MKNIIAMLVTAGGKVVCARCAAKSKRSGEQCKKPAMRGKAVCDFLYMAGKLGCNEPSGLLLQRVLVSWKT
jgi:hypothetical protein